MSDFKIRDIDYVDFIKTDEDLTKFNRMKDLLFKMSQVPGKEYFEELVEAVKIDRELRHLPEVKLIRLPNNPRLN